MQTLQYQIESLIGFKLRDKFSAKAWEDRGLNASSFELSQNMTRLINLATDDLIDAIKSNRSGRQLKNILNQGLARFKKPDYDTEEKEFICDLFHELATIINIDFKDNLNIWLYGSFLITFMKVKNFFNPERIVDTIKQPCSACGTQLESYVMQKETGIPEYGWYLVKCGNCKALNLLSCGTGIKQLKFGNYEYVETLSKVDYTYEEALTRLEQIRFFRK